MTTVDQLIYTRAVTLRRAPISTMSTMPGFLSGTWLRLTRLTGVTGTSKSCAHGRSVYVTQRLTELAPASGVSSVWIRTCIGGSWGALTQQGAQGPACPQGPAGPAGSGGGGGVNAGSTGTSIAAFGGSGDFNPDNGAGTDNTAAPQAAINSGQKVLSGRQTTDRGLRAGPGALGSISRAPGSVSRSSTAPTSRAGRSSATPPRTRRRASSFTGIDMIAWGGSKTEGAFELYFPPNPSNTNTPRRSSMCGCARQRRRQLRSFLEVGIKLVTPGSRSSRAASPARPISPTRAASREYRRSSSWPAAQPRA